MHSAPRIRKAVGIDLGTTHSAIALLDPTDSNLLCGCDEQGRRAIASLVGYDPEQRRLIAGRAAQALLGLGSPHDVAVALPLESIRSFMGSDRRFAVGAESLSPPQASACILRHLRELLARTLADARYRLDTAVLTVPPGFKDKQLEAMRQAAALADFEAVEWLPEPIAAVLYYSWTLGHGDGTYLVYDLGGGSFDVSIVRQRRNEHEILAVSAEPLLCGKEFDWILARHIIEAGRWSMEDNLDPIAAADSLFDPATPAGTVRLACLMHAAEGIKIALTDAPQVERFIPALVRDEAGRSLNVEIALERSEFHQLMQGPIDRTIDCCREALARAQEQAGLRQGDIDHVLLVGGGSQMPLVREAVAAAFCSDELSEHVRNREPLMHEPDLSVAYGAAIRAAMHGTRYVWGLAHDSHAEELELHLKSPGNSPQLHYQASGVVRILAAPGESTQPTGAWSGVGGPGSSVRIRSLSTGLMEEAFLDEAGRFTQDLELEVETDNVFEFALCDVAGREAARTLVIVRHQPPEQRPDPARLPRQIVTKPLCIEVLGRRRQRVRQVIVPIGAALPGSFRCTFRTRDQSGRMVMPIYEANRVVHQVVLDNLDPSLPVGSPVEVELAIDARRAIEVHIQIPAGEGGSERKETARIETPPPEVRPTRAQIDQVQQHLEKLLALFSESVRSRLQTRAVCIRDDLLEALRTDDEPRAIQRMAELRALLQDLESGRDQALDPPWPRFARLVRQCLDLAAETADRTGCDREELFEHVRAQERYAEQAYEEQNQALYQECFQNLNQYASYLDRLRQDALPGPAPRPCRPPQEEARGEIERFRQFLSSVWKRVRARGRTDLEARLSQIAGQAAGLSQRIKSEPLAAIRETYRLGAEVEKVGEQLEGRQQPDPDAGLLEGSC